MNLLSARPCCPETPVAAAAAPPVAPLELLVAVRPKEKEISLIEEMIMSHCFQNLLKRQISQMS